MLRSPSARPASATGSIGRAPVDSATVTTPAPRHRRLLATLAGFAAAWLVAGTVLGHASLVSSDPAAGAVLATSPTTITLVFDDDLDPARSSFAVRGASGDAAAGHVSATDARTMTASALSLAPGAWEIRWTAVASDGDLTRGTVDFTIAAAGSTVPASASPGASAAASAAASAVTSGSTAPSAVASAPGAPSASTAPDGSTTPDASTSAPVVLAIVGGLVLVVGLGAAILRRSRAA